jgi:formate dehydrogenase assembly factor FdhD
MERGQGQSGGGEADTYDDDEGAAGLCSNDGHFVGQELDDERHNAVDLVLVHEVWRQLEEELQTV